MANCNFSIGDFYLEFLLVADHFRTGDFDPLRQTQWTLREVQLRPRRHHHQRILENGIVEGTEAAEGIVDKAIHFE